MTACAVRVILRNQSYSRIVTSDRRAPAGAERAPRPVGARVRSAQSHKMRPLCVARLNGLGGICDQANARSVAYEYVIRKSSRGKCIDGGRTIAGVYTI